MLLVVVVGVIYNMWKKRDLLRSAKQSSGVSRLTNVPSTALKIFAREVIAQKSLFDCGKTFWVEHFCLFWGFVGAGVTTTLVYLFHNNGLALPLTDPTKIIGNVSAALLLVGGTIVVGKRIGNTYSRQNTLSYDAFFLLLFYGTAVTGFLTELSRLSEVELLAYSVYVVHLGFIILLLALAPWTKFSHAIYRPVVTLYDRLVSSGMSLQ